jgi:hypothetical protein
MVLGGHGHGAKDKRVHMHSPKNGRPDKEETLAQLEARPTVHRMLCHLCLGLGYDGIATALYRS